MVHNVRAGLFGAAITLLVFTAVRADETASAAPPGVLQEAAAGVVPTPGPAPEAPLETPLPPVVPAPEAPAVRGAEAPPPAQAGAPTEGAVKPPEATPAAVPPAPRVSDGQPAPEPTPPAASAAKPAEGVPAPAVSGVPVPEVAPPAQAVGAPPAPLGDTPAPRPADTPVVPEPAAATQVPAPTPETSPVAAPAPVRAPEQAPVGVPAAPAPPGTPQARPPRVRPAAPGGIPATSPRQPAAQAPRKVAMNFKDAEIEAIVKFISELMGMNFILDDTIKNKKITVISPSQLTVEEAYEVFQSILVVKGLTVVPTGKMFKIVPSSQARQTSIETVPDKTAAGDRFVTRILPLRRVPVENLTAILTPLVSKEGSVVPYSPTNTLIITDSYTNIERVAEIIAALDVETVDTVLEIIPIRYAAAEAISRSLLQTVAEKSKVPKKRPGTTPGAAATPATAESVGAKIIPDTRTNSLIVIADLATLEDIKTVIRALDVEIPRGTGKINVYYLKYADAENVSAVLTAISKTASTKAKPGQPGQPATPAAPQGPVGGKVGGEISVEFEEPVQITADKATNSLVIIATPQDFELLKSVIARLDIRRPQVLVEAFILEMSYKKSLELGVEWRTTTDPTKGGNQVVGSSGFGNISNVMANPFSLGTGLVLAAVDGTLTYGGKTFANIGAMVNALQGTGDINVLSTPHLLTTNNEEAEIIVSDNIPFQTSQKFDNNGNPIYTYDYKDVGLTLRLTPQINDDAYVKLKVFQETSQLLSATTGTTSNAPSTSKRQAKTTVVVKDAATVVIGGLVKDNILKNVSSVPCLGDLPLLGYLFRHSTDTKEKTNLLIFLTPHIINSTEDLEKLSDTKRREFEADARNPLGGPEGGGDKAHKYLDKQKGESKP